MVSPPAGAAPPVPPMPPEPPLPLLEAVPPVPPPEVLVLVFVLVSGLLSSLQPAQHSKTTVRVAVSVGNQPIVRE